MINWIIVIIMTRKFDIFLCRVSSDDRDVGNNMPNFLSDCSLLE